MSGTNLNDLLYVVNSEGLQLDVSDLAEAGVDAHRLVLDLVANGRDFASVNRVMHAHLDEIGITRLNTAIVGAVYALVTGWLVPLMDAQPDAEEARAMAAEALKDGRAQS
jgi:hypothetical protein